MSSFHAFAHHLPTTQNILTTFKMTVAVINRPTTARRCGAGRPSPLVSPRGWLSYQSGEFSDMGFRQNEDINGPFETTIETDRQGPTGASCAGQEECGEVYTDLRSEQSLERSGR
ncbi:hypothetical protein CKAH01_09948 [Colletotrichum kahawae]|uniref:Uncharacterized protein n=1 Tax=Colletotrichum kahawae TaxID=34407 RepID=A0AAD9XYS9_COLKA|nr:hypothetical protein CKAH01_09948 [Colletotrichum kahawae]